MISSLAAMLNNDSTVAIETIICAWSGLNKENKDSLFKSVADSIIIFLQPTNL